MIRSDRLLAFALGASFFALCLGWGLAFDRHAPEIFRDNDRAFDADTPNRIICLTRAEGAHYLTRLHPLFVLLLNPVGLGLRALLGLVGVARPGRVAALAMAASAAGMGVAMLFVLLRRLRVDPLFALLWAVTFGVSSSQMFFGVVPETFVFSGAGLLILLVVFSSPRSSEPLRLAASVGAFGMAVTNLAMVVLLRVRALPPATLLREAVRRTSGHVLRLLVVAACLSALQLGLYPRTVLFFARGGVPSDDLHSVYWPVSASGAVDRAADVVWNFTFANLAAPEIAISGAGTARPAVEFGPPSWSALRGLGRVHALLWMVVLAAGLASGRTTGLYRVPVVRALVAWVALHVVLHFFFGMQLFLYSCQWTFAVIALAALAWDRLLARRPAWRPSLALVLGALALLAAANNTVFLREVFAVFA